MKSKTDKNLLMIFPYNYIAEEEEIIKFLLDIF